MKGADVQIRQNSERRIVDLLAKLMKTRVTGSDADPKDSGRSFDGKHTGTFKRKWERLHFDGFQSGDQRIPRLDFHISQKTQRQVKLAFRRPPDMPQRCFQAANDRANWVRRM